MLIQIYEIQTPYEAEKCVSLGVDHIGSVILTASDWRQPHLREVVRATRAAGAKSNLIPLFQDMETLSRLVDYYEPDFLHFCESLTDEGGNQIDLDPIIQLQTVLKERFPEILITRTIPVPPNPGTKDFPSLNIARELAPVSDLFLIDTWVGKEPVEGFVGITGLPADQAMARQVVLASPIPVLLAGGLSPENVYDSLMQVVPAGADSCTHTNKRDEAGRPVRFEKDFQRVEGFVKEVRRAEEAIRSKGAATAARLGKLREELAERQKALPAHSIRPHQLLAIEDLEDEIAGLEVELRYLTRFRSNSLLSKKSLDSSRRTS